MKNVINYYYNLNPNKIKKIFNYYYFYLNNELYYFIIYTRKQEDINAIYNFNQELVKKNILVNEIINNKNNTIITIVNKIPYILVKIQINQNKDITLSEINYLSNILIRYPDNLMRSNWANLWITKIDYLEYQLEQNNLKYPLLRDSFNYFVGLAENAISYLNNTVSTLKPEKTDIGVISHNTILIDDSAYSLYNPLNIIIDHKSRDIAEYIKTSFFKDNYKIFDELDEYFKHKYYSFYGINLLISRILYPSFYFELYDNIINKEKNESELLKITSRINEYENYLEEIFNYFHKYYNIKDINWLKKNKLNLH